MTSARTTSSVGRHALVSAGMPAAAFAVLLLALWFGGGRPRPAIEGLPSPGPLTTWGLPLVRLVHDLSAVATVGVLLTAVLLAQDEDERRRIARAAAPWALVWAASAALTEVLTLSDFLGLPVGDALRSGVLTTFLYYIPQGQAFLLVTLVALTVAVGALLPLDAGGRALLLALAVFAVLPPAYAGHSASAADHNLAISSLMAHIPGVALWVGGLAGLVAFLPGSAGLLTAVRRFSALALCCFVAVGVSGTVNAWVRLGEVSQLWESRYGLLVLAKAAALAALGWFGWRHRRATIAALETEGPRPFLRLATVEVAVMLATVGLAVGLSRTAPPASDGVPGVAQHQHDALGYTLPPYTPGRLVTEIRPDPIALLAVAGLVAAYLAGVRRLSARGEGWPAWRTASWLAGLLVLAYGLAGGVAAYGPAVFSIHSAQYALLGAVGPALLVLGAPLGLYRRAVPSAGEREDGPWARALSLPWVATALYAAPYVALYLTGLFEAAQTSLAVRLGLQAVVVATAVVFLEVATGVDPLPRPIRPQVRAAMLLAGVAVQAWVALELLAGPLQGPGWYASLALPWGPERNGDQQLGALLGPGAAALTLAALLVLLLLRWRDARRRLSAGVARAG
ncbi:cytochrome c oxidase assembly protein [Microbispora corallina]|uniref:cytochrome c oxidase assembly protein n=1 Tax=Microbispora corallina TaxID=83302 RepID=UPI00194F9E12|nr:cytochrome c oxidase assembly protein [Microbispora corallina]